MFVCFMSLESPFLRWQFSWGYLIARRFKLLFESSILEFCPFQYYKKNLRNPLSHELSSYEPPLHFFICLELKSQIVLLFWHLLFVLGSFKTLFCINVLSLDFLGERLWNQIDVKFLPKSPITSKTTRISSIHNFCL